MELIKPGTNFDFVGRRTVAIALSCLLIALSLAVLAVRGPNYGIDFTGGTVVQLAFAEKHGMSEVRDALVPLGMQGAEIQDFTDDFGSATSSPGSEFLIRLPLASEDMGETSKAVTQAMRDKFGDESFEIQRVEIVGPRVGASLRNQAILAVLFATLMMGVYIWFRFELRFGVGAYAALAHDVIVTVVDGCCRNPCRSRA